MSHFVLKHDLPMPFEQAKATKVQKKQINQINLLRQTQEVSEEVGARERFEEAGGYLVSLDSAGFGWLT